MDLINGEINIVGTWIINLSNVTCEGGSAFPATSSGLVFASNGTINATDGTTGTYVLNENQLSFNLSNTLDNETDVCDNNTQTTIYQTNTMIFTGTYSGRNIGGIQSFNGTFNFNHKEFYVSGNTTCFYDINFNCSGPVILYEFTN